MSWTDERIDLLRKLWLDGLSASRIAAELADGVTRNAVIGKVHRLGLSGRVKPVAPPTQARLREAVPQAIGASGRRRAAQVGDRCAARSPSPRRRSCRCSRNARQATSCR